MCYLFAVRVAGSSRVNADVEVGQLLAQEVQNMGLLAGQLNPAGYAVVFTQQQARQARHVGQYLADIILTKGHFIRLTEVQVSQVGGGRKCAWQAGEPVVLQLQLLEPCNRQGSMTSLTQPLLLAQNGGCAVVACMASYM